MKAVTPVLAARAVQVPVSAERTAVITRNWYGRTGAPYQFLAMTALRSAENRVWTARAANTGVSAIIDDRGRIREATDIYEQAVVVAEVPLVPPGDVPTFYARHGNVFAHACWASGLSIATRGPKRIASP